MLSLSLLTGWGLADIEGMEIDDFWAFLEDAQVLQNEIKEAAKR